jgi:cell shape-determining protein MreD
MAPGRLLAGLAFAAVASAAIGIRIGNPYLLPLLNAGPAWLAMIALVVRGRRAQAVLVTIWWAAWLGAATTILCAADPWGSATSAIVHGSTYYQEMRGWIETGAGCESTPSCFIPAQLLHAGIFSALALVTAGAAAILMGAVLMNYMAYFVGSLAAGAVTPIAATILAWVPWSLVRIVSFIALGVVLAEPLAFALAGGKAPPRRALWIGLAIGGLALDILLKTWLAPKWPPMLRLFVHG